MGRSLVLCAASFAPGSVSTKSRRGPHQGSIKMAYSWRPSTMVQLAGAVPASELPETNRNETTFACLRSETAMPILTAI